MRRIAAGRVGCALTAALMRSYVAGYPGGLPYAYSQPPHAGGQPTAWAQQGWVQSPQPQPYAAGAAPLSPEQQQAQWAAWQQRQLQQQYAWQRPPYADPAQQQQPQQLSAEAAQDSEDIYNMGTNFFFLTSVLVLVVAFLLNQLVDVETDIERVKHIPLVLDLPDPKEKKNGRNAQ